MKVSRIITLIASVLFIFAAQQKANAQLCFVTVVPQDTLICPGEPVTFQAFANLLNAGQVFDFNSGLPAGWTVAGGSAFGSPCEPSLDGTPHYWASTAGSTPAITTPGFDVTCGGVIFFEMDYAIQSGPQPCEGMEVWDEGVELQYSTDNGATWIPIIYYAPDGNSWPSKADMVATGTWLGVPAPWSQTTYVPAGTTNAFTSWAQYQVPIPPGALTTNTQFRWIQEASSSAVNDNWGLDNIVINATGAPCGNEAIVNWSNGLMDTTSFTVNPTVDTNFVAFVFDTAGNFQCQSDTVFVTVYQDDMTYDLVDTVFSFCPFDTITASIENLSPVPGPVTYNWSNGSVLDSASLGGGPNGQDEIWFYVDVTDGCGFVRSDSVVMVVNQTLQVDTTIAQNATACTPTGIASAFVSGVTSTGGQPFYNWTGPGGPPGAFSVDGTVIDNVPSGWYYFTVIDDVCEVSDSVFIDIDEPPIAEFTPTNASGCSPVQVNFVNSSQNTVSYLWDFGDGSPQETAQNVSHSFTQSSTVTLIAEDASGCADTAYATVDVILCGCTDPLAINYDPLAQQDDNTCVFPVPVVNAPNVITPNNDDINDFFFFETEFTESITVVITNRWGNVIFEATGDNPTWDGTDISGNPAAQGVYFYKYSAVGVIPDQQVEGHGFVHLERNEQ